MASDPESDDKDDKDGKPRKSFIPESDQPETEVMTIQLTSSRPDSHRMKSMLS
jgi:hypothetical protein